MVAHAHIMRVRAAPKGFFWGLSGSVGSVWVVLGRFGSLVRSKTLIIIQGQKALLLVLSAQQRSSAAAPGNCFFRH